MIKKSTKKSTSKPKKKTVYQKKLNILMNEGLHYRVTRDEAVRKLSILQSDFDNARQAWSRQESLMLAQINHLQIRLDFLDIEKSNLMEVLLGLGGVLGGNKSELQRLNSTKTNKQNYTKNALNYEASNKQ